MKIALVKILFSVCLGYVSLQGADKPYGVQNGYIVYETVQIQPGTQKTITTKTVAFTNWGAVELVEENGTISTAYGTFPLHTMYKHDGHNTYSVDFQNKRIIKKTVPQPSSEAGKITTNPINAKNPALKKEKVLGYPCEIWESSSGKIWIYRGIVMKYVLENNMTSIRNEAVRVYFNETIDHPELQLPDYPVQTLQANSTASESGVTLDTSVGELIEGAEVINSLIQ